jgi:molybdenum cofactor cytidylyltransferase
MITGIILASGLSKRMKRDKLLIELNEKPIIEYVIKAAVRSNLDHVILVYRKEIVKVIAKKYKVDTIYNDNAHLGQSQAIKLGVSKSHKDSSLMFLMGDQPFVNSELINKLILKYKKNKLPILVPYYNGNRGMPNIFGPIYRKELLKVEGDAGGREILKRDHLKIHRVDIVDRKLGIDIDTQEDLERVRRWL